MLFRYDNEFEKRKMKFKPTTKLNYSGSYSAVLKPVKLTSDVKQLIQKKPLRSQHNRAKGNNCLNKHPREDARLRGVRDSSRGRKKLESM